MDSRKIKSCTTFYCFVRTIRFTRSSVDFEQAYREVEIVNRSIECVLMPLNEIPFIVDGGSPSKRLIS